MKNLVFILFYSMILLSCKSWDPAFIRVQKEPIKPKLLTLEPKMQDLGNTIISTNDDELKLFTKEVEENLIDPYGDKYDYIVMKKNVIEFNFGSMPWMILNGILLQTPQLFGVPNSKPKLTIEIEFRIMDSKNKLIGKYNAIGIGKNTVALYYGYSIKDAYRKTHVDAINDAINQIRPQIQLDADRLNKLLIEAGRL